MFVLNSQLHLSVFIIHNIIERQLAVISYPRLLLELDKCAEEWTLKWWSGFTKPALLNPTMFYRQEFYTQASPEPNSGPQGRNFILTSLFGADILSSVFTCFPKQLLSNWPKQRPPPLACQRRVMRFYGQQRGRLCTETAAGAALTVAVLLLAPHCSQDEVHRCSHSVQWFIGCLKQCISVKNNSS